MTTRLTVALIFASVVSGCTSVKNLTPSFARRSTGPRPVVDVLALWQPGEGRDAEGLPTRGFAGQVLFFEAGSRKPVKVDGDISIVVFDDQGDIEEQKKPLHEFHFRGGAWDGFRQESNLGHAYQLFIPYTRDGSHQAVCSVRVKLTDETGRQVLSDAGNVLLAGDMRTTPSSVRITQSDKPSRKLKSERLFTGSTRSNLLHAKTAARESANRFRGTERESTVEQAGGFGQFGDTNRERHESTIQQTSYRLRPAKKPHTQTDTNTPKERDDAPRVYSVPLSDRSSY